MSSRYRELFLLEVAKGALTPVDGFTAERLRAKGYHIGDILSATLVKSRNPGFHRLAHAFGKLCADNIEAFANLPAHTVLKRIQFEADIACERMQMLIKPLGLVEVKLPKSLGFASMDDGEFKEVFRAMCNHVAETYWQGCTAEQIEQMASAMPDAA